MTNGEYQKKHHRGSSPSHEGESGASSGNISSEEWKNLNVAPLPPSTPAGTMNEKPGDDIQRLDQ